MRIGTVWGLKVITGMAFSSGQTVGTWMPARCKRPCGRRATEKRDERAAFHSRTSLARAMNTCDKETPSKPPRLTPM
jgi:hypothetical protein